MQCLKPTDERLALSIGAVLFGLLGLAQGWRFCAHIPVTFGTLSVPIWPSALIALIGLSMACWYMYLAKHHKASV